MANDQTAAEIKAILQGPHKYVNGQYVPYVPEPEASLKEIEAKIRAAAGKFDPSIGIAKGSK